VTAIGRQSGGVDGCPRSGAGPTRRRCLGGEQRRRPCRRPDRRLRAACASRHHPPFLSGSAAAEHGLLDGGRRGGRPPWAPLAESSAPPRTLESEPVSHVNQVRHLDPGPLGRSPMRCPVTARHGEGLRLVHRGPPPSRRRFVIRASTAGGPRDEARLPSLSARRTPNRTMQRRGNTRPCPHSSPATASRP
jgi:hypothetical protein